MFSFCVWFCDDRCPYKECHSSDWHFLLVILPLVSMREGFTLFAYNSIPQRAPVVGARKGINSMLQWFPFQEYLFEKESFSSSLRSDLLNQNL